MEERSETMWIGLTESRLDVKSADQFLRHASVGGIAIFVGTTREWTMDRQTTSLHYEAYESMALAEMKVLADTVMKKWPAVRVCLLHRLGAVNVAEASVVVGVATPHRSDAFEACRFLIDTLKETVPIWKRETFSDGTTSWVGDPLNSTD